MTKNNNSVTVAVTGAGGNIAYSLLFYIAAGLVFGNDTHINFKLVEIPVAVNKAKGTAMELQDSAFPLLDKVEIFDNHEDGFQDAEYVFLLGSAPRKEGMVRADLLGANAPIFERQGKALNDFAAAGVKVLVVGNPVNTNAWLLLQHAPKLNPRQVTALTRLDHDRALSMLANKIDQPVGLIKKMVVWGNHADSQFPDITYTEISRKSCVDLVDATWINEVFIPKVAGRGFEIVRVRGNSSAASAAMASAQHMRDWVQGTPADDWVSVALPSQGEYGVPEGIVFGYPCISKNGEWEVVSDLQLNKEQQARLQFTIDDLVKEKEAALQL